MKTIKPHTRRKFLLAAGIGSAGAVAAVATKGVKAPAPAAPKTAEGDGYRLSEHIQKYYKTTEV
ncbi:MAG TPA: formate dehydrogenase [Usitatibacter sp.]|jgi:hypothetical protein|nr:formate dehydrogenase [Usitatibacter sp.]